MQTPHAEGYLLAVALFLVCCWVYPNDAIPYRTRPQAREQVDHRVGNGAGTRTVNVARRAIRQPDVEVDEISTLSGGGKRWRTSQRPRSHRSRMKNININTNTNVMVGANRSTGRVSKIDKPIKQFPKIDQQAGRLPSIVDVATYDVSKTSMEPTLVTEAINCSEPHNANDRYSSSFNGNSTTETLNVGDDFQVAGEAGTKKTTSVHVGEDITLCWIETTTIKEDRSFHPVQRFVIREYTISFENSATIPERYLECVQLEGEIDRKNNSIPRSTLFEIMDENTRHSRVVNFTTVSHSDDLTVWQHRRVRCGVGPVVTKNIIEWTDERSENTKNRVEIKVSPKIHRLTAQPTDAEPCTTDLVDPQLISSVSTNLSPPVDCGPGMTCISYSGCVDENCVYFTNPSEASTSPDLEEVTTQSYTTPPAADEEKDKLTDATDDHESNELLSTGGMKEPLLVTDETTDSSEKMTTPVVVTTETIQDDDGLSTVAPMEVTTIVDDESWPTTSDIEMSSSTESGAAFGITMIHKTNNSMKIGNQEVEITAHSEEVNLSTSEIDDSCDSEDSCADSASEDSTTSWENSSNSETEFTDSVTRRDGETGSIEDFATTPTTNASELTTGNETDYLYKEEWETTTATMESRPANPITETIENTATSVGGTEERSTITEIINIGSTITEPTESNSTMTELTDGNIAVTEPSEIIRVTQCDHLSGDCAESFEVTTSKDKTESTESGLEPTSVPTMTTRMVGVVTPKRVMNTHFKKNKTEFGLLEFSTTEMSTMEVGGMNENTTSETSSAQPSSEVLTTEETTTQEPSPTSCESDGNCDFSFKSDVSDVTPAVIELETKLGGEVTTEVTTTGYSSAITEVTITSTTLGRESIAEETTTHINDVTPEMTRSEIRLGGETTTEEATTDMISVATEVTMSATTSSDSETSQDGTTTVVSDASPKVTEPETKSHGRDTAEEFSTEISGANTEVTTSSITFVGEAFTEKATTDINKAAPGVTEPETRLYDEATTEDVTTEISGATTKPTTSSITFGGEAFTERATTDINKEAPGVMEPKTRSYDEATTEDVTTEISGATIEPTTSSIIFSGETLTEEATTDINEAAPVVTEPEIRSGDKTTTEEAATQSSNTTLETEEPQIGLGDETTTEEVTTEVSGATTEVTISSTTLGGEAITEETTIDINEVAPEVTEPQTRFGGETTTEETTTDATSEITALSTTEASQPEFTIFALRGATETSTGIYTGGSTTADGSAESTTGIVFSTTIEQSDLGTITKTIPDSNSTNPVQLNDEPAVVKVTETTSSTTNAIGEGSAESTTESISDGSSVETTTNYSIESNVQTQITEEAATLHPCDSEADRCVSKNKSTPSSCNGKTEECFADPTILSDSPCDEESSDCSASTTSSSTLSCDEKSDDCTVVPSSISTAECNENSSSSCTVTNDNQPYSTSTDSSEMCDTIGTGNCTIAPEVTDLPPTTTSTPIEVENISTTVSDVPTTVESRRSTTVKAMSRSSNPQHKLALKIKILLEHIDDNKKRQKLVEVEKHLLFDEQPNEHGQRSLMKQVRSLNNTVSMKTVQALFNCSTVEKLTADVGDFAAKYLTLHDKIPHDQEPNRDSNSIDGLHARKPRDLSPPVERDVDKNVEMSLPGIHADIHAGLSHVMTRVPPEHEVEQQNVGMSKKIRHSRLLEVVADPRDERIHARRKRQTIDDFTIDKLDLPTDVEEVGHWSNERVRRATDSGHVRTLTEFTIYKGP